MIWWTWSGVLWSMSGGAFIFFPVVMRDPSANCASRSSLSLQEAIQAVRDSLEGEETVEECPKESEDSEQ
jgi:hypothetical protein